MVGDVGERGGKPLGDRTRPQQRRRVARNAGEAANGAVGVDQRLLPGQTPALASVGIEMELHPVADREPFREHLEILRFVSLAERRGAKTWLALRPISARLSGELAAMGEGFVDRDVARL